MKLCLSAFAFQATPAFVAQSARASSKSRSLPVQTSRFVRCQPLRQVRENWHKAAAFASWPLRRPR